MSGTSVEVFGGVVWGGNPHAPFRVPTSAEAQNTVLTELLETPFREEHRNPLDWFLSLMVHSAVVTAVVFAPLLFTQAIDVHGLRMTYLVTPAPPAAPAPPPAAAAVQKTPLRRLAPYIQGKLTAPSVVPRQVVIVHDAESAPDVTGGVIGGIPGGTIGGLLGGIIGGAGAPTAPAPGAAPQPEKKEKEILRVGGNITPPRELFKPPPKYPALAGAAHVVGAVLIEAVIDERGDVVDVRALRGDPLLIPEALRTVMQWKYEPTYLNGVPYPVRLTVTVSFSLVS